MYSLLTLLTYYNKEEIDISYWNSGLNNGGVVTLTGDYF